MGRRKKETPESILPGSPRVGALDALLREVDGLRLTLETDLSLAASAVESGHPALAADILDSDRGSVAAFEARALGHLQDLADASAPDVVPLARRRRLPLSVSVAPFAAAAAVIAVVLTLAPQSVPPSEQLAPTSAAAAVDQIAEAAASGDMRSVREASAVLHEQLMAAVASAQNDPEMAKQALLLLGAEREAIVASGDIAALQDVLRRSAQLSNRILAKLPKPVRLSIPPVPTIPAEQPQPSSAPSASPKPKPTASPSTSPAPKPSSSPNSSPSASPSSSPSDGGVPLGGNPMGGDDKADG